MKAENFCIWGGSHTSVWFSSNTYVRFVTYSFEKLLLTPSNPCFSFLFYLKGRDMETEILQLLINAPCAHTAARAELDQNQEAGTQYWSPVSISRKLDQKSSVRLILKQNMLFPSSTLTAVSKICL